MRKVKFLAVTVLFVIISLIFIKFSFFPILRYFLGKNYNINISVGNVTFCGIDCVSFENLQLRKESEFNILIKNMKFVPGQKTTSLFTAQTVLKQFIIDGAEIEMHERLFEGDRETPFSLELPFFPLEYVDLTNISISLYLENRRIRMQDVSLTGETSYILNAADIEIIDIENLQKRLIGTFSAKFTADGYRYDLNDLNAEIPGVTIDGSYDSAVHSYNAHIDVDLKTILSYVDKDLAQKLNGSLQLDTSLHFDENIPSLHVSMTGTDFAVTSANMVLWDLYGDIRIFKKGVYIDRVVLFDNKRPIISLNGAGYYTDQKISGRTQLFDVDFMDTLTRLNLPCIVNMGVSGTIDYVFDFEEMQGDLDASLVAVDFDVKNNYILDLDDRHYVDLTATINGTQARLHNGHIYTADNSSDVFLSDSWWDLDGDKQLEINIVPESKIDLGRIKKIAGFDVGGVAQLTGQIYSFYNAVKIDGDLKIENCSFEGFSAHRCDLQTSLRNFVLSFTAKDIRQSTIRSKDAGVFIDLNKEPVVDFYAGELIGNFKDLPKLLHKPMPLNGDFVISLSGRYKDGRMNKFAAIGVAERITMDKYKVADSVRLNLVDDGDVIQVNNSFVNYGDTQFLLDGTITNDTFQADVDVSMKSFFKKDFSFLDNIMFIAPRISGHISGFVLKPHIDASLFLGKVEFKKIKMGNLAVSADYTFEDGHAAVKGNLGKAMSFTSNIVDWNINTLNADVSVRNFLHRYEDSFVKLSFDAAVRKGYLKATFNKFFIEKSKLFVRNTAPLKVYGTYKKLKIEPTFFDGEAINFEVSGLLKKGIPYLTFKGTLFPRVVDQFYLEHFSDTRGRARFNLKLEDRFLSGMLRVNNLSTRLKSFPLAFSKLTGNIMLNKNNVSIEEITGYVNGGRLLLKGAGDIQKNSAELSVNITNAQTKHQLVGNFSFSTMLDIVLSKNESPFINGEIELKNITYRDDISIENELINALLKSRKYDFEEKSDMMMNPRFNLRLYGKNNIRINSNLIKTSVFFDTQLTGTVKKPEVNGTITLRDGRLYFRQNEFDLQRGIISLATDIDIKPYLDVEGSTTIFAKSKEREYKMVLRVTGPATNPQVILDSIPELDETSKYALLLTGDFIDDTTDNTGAGNWAISAVTDIIGIDEELKKNFRLSKFEIVPKYSEIDNKTVLKVVAVKELYPFLFLTIESNPSDTGDQLMELRYRGNKVDFLVDWRNKNKLENSFGGIGFDIRLNYIKE